MYSSNKIKVLALGLLAAGLVSGAAAQQINIEGWQLQAADLAVNLQAAVTAFDPRGGPSPSAIPSQQNTAPLAGIGNTPAIVELPISTSFTVIGGVNQNQPLLPGTAMQIRCSTVNVQITGYIWWKERFLEDSERS